MKAVVDENVELSVAWVGRPIVSKRQIANAGACKPRVNRFGMPLRCRQAIGIRYPVGQEAGSFHF